MNNEENNMKKCSKCKEADNGQNIATACAQCRINGKQYCKACEKTGDSKYFSGSRGNCNFCKSEKMYRCDECYKENKDKSRNFILCKECSENDNKFCKDCKNVGKFTCFEARNRNSCKTCRTPKELTLEEKQAKFNKLPLIKKCQGKCQLELPKEKFDMTDAGGIRNTCKTCRSSGRKKTISKEDLKSIFENIMKICERCGKNKEISQNFTIHTNSYRNVCKKCYNSKGYYKKYRERKRKEDEEGFRKHNSEIHKKWTDKNAVYWKRYMTKYVKTERGKLSRYLTKAKERGLEINDEEIKKLLLKLFNEVCFYCGGNRDIGVDRINSNEKYTEENCVACCSLCNAIKNTMDIASFIRKVRDIAVFNRETIELSEEYWELYDFHSNQDLIGRSGGFTKYKKSAVIRKKNFELSEDEFNEIIKNKCYICGNTNSINAIGVDREDNMEGYTLNNCRPCCSYCNYMKKNYTYSRFLKQIKLITEHSISELHYELCDISVFNKMISKRIEKNPGDQMYQGEGSSKNTSRKSRIKKEEPLEKECKGEGCGKILPISEFSKGRNVCKKCRQKQKLNPKNPKGKSPIIVEITEKECSECKQLLPIKKFGKCNSGNRRNKCRKCEK